MDLKTGESLVLSGPATIALLRKTGQLSRLLITADHDVLIVKKDDKEQEKNIDQVVPSMAH